MQVVVVEKNSFETPVRNLEPGDIIKTRADTYYLVIKKADGTSERNVMCLRSKELYSLYNLDELVKRIPPKNVTLTIEE